MAFIAGAFSWSNAETVVLKSSEASDFVGTFSEEKLKDDGSLQEAAKYQPISSLKIKGYTISFSKAGGGTEPAFYLAPSTQPDTDPQMRVYKNNTISIAAPNGESISKVTYVVKGKTDGVEMNGSFADGKYTWTNGTGGNIQIVTLNVTLGEGGDTPTPPNPPTPPTPPTEENILSVENAADIQGELYEEVMGDDGKVKSGQRVQPLESLEIDGYVFSFTSGTNEKTAPAFYWPTSTNADGKKSIRIYVGNTMTITAPAGKTFTSLVSTPDNSSVETTIYAGEAVNTITYTATGTLRINTIKVGTGEVEVPEQKKGFYKGLETNADDWTLDVGEIPDGLSYVWSYDSKYGIKATAYVNKVRYATDVWAISPVIDLTEAESADLKFSQAANFLSGNFDMITTAIREEYGEWTPITVSPLPSGDSWTYVDSMASLVDFVGKKIQIGFNYKSTEEVASTWEIKNLSVEGATSTSVQEIETVDTPAEYYTLQGVKVANPENGIFIRVKNGKATKILMK